jgi:outer membrane protein OmpA-like peptidoglycan-associated protein
LVSRNVAANRLTVVGYGETTPKYENDTDAGRAQNRRVEFLISANEKMRAEAEKEASK